MGRPRTLWVLVAMLLMAAPWHSSLAEEGGGPYASVQVCIRKKSAFPSLGDVVGFMCAFVRRVCIYAFALCVQKCIAPISYEWID